MAKIMSTLMIDCACPHGTMRALHGVNHGPLCNFGTVDLSPYYRELAIPSVRLNDSLRMYADTVDVDYIFPVFEADPDDPANYRFEQTDDYLQAIKDAGADIVYRLGPSIEHTRTKSHIFPPSDHAKWARICINIIRHYNEGWANGFHHDIRYWEIWNEPDSPKCWAGTEDEFVRLFVTAAKEIKAHTPTLKVGGPSLARGGVRDGLLPKLLAACADAGTPLDFVSWHRYAATPWELRDAAVVVREVLDAYGFTTAESHINEWNHLPSRDWGVAFGNDAVQRRAMFRKITGMPGAAFDAAALIVLQDSPVEGAHFYLGDTNRWGLFDQHGVPNKTYYAFLAFARLLAAPRRVAADGAGDGVALCAGLSEDGRQVAVLVSNVHAELPTYDVVLRGMPWNGPTRCETFMLDADHDLECVSVEQVNGHTVTLRKQVSAPSVMLLRLNAI